MSKFFITLLLPLCLLQAVTPAARAQRPAPGFTSLSLFAEPEKAEVTVGEPLIVKLRVTNLNESDIDARAVLDPAYGALQLYVSRNGGDFKRYLGPGWGTKDRMGGLSGVIKPGTDVYGEVSLLYHNALPGRSDLLESSVPLGETGSYVIRVELYDETFERKIVAPAFAVQVGFPQEEAGQAVWEAVKSDKDLAYFMQTGDARQSGAVVQKAERLVEHYADGRYEKHLSLALGRYYLAKDKVETAIGYLKGAAAAEPASSVRALALLELTRSYVSKGEVDEALKISDGASDEFNEGEVRQELERLRSTLRPAGKSTVPKQE
jgi:tetratricopeptide (TPR) repeat protein